VAWFTHAGVAVPDTTTRRWLWPLVLASRSLK
jgi:hypothetical protein